MWYLPPYIKSAEFCSFDNPHPPSQRMVFINSLKYYESKAHVTLVSNILSIVDQIVDQLGFNGPNNIKIQIANDQYVNLAKLLLNSSESNDDVQSLTVSYETVLMYQQSKAITVTSIQM